MAILGGIIAVVALFLSFAIQNHVHKETGVWVSRSNLRYVRRQAPYKDLQLIERLAAQHPLPPEP